MNETARTNGSVTTHFNTEATEADIQVSIDTGGTFTDFVVCRDGRWQIHKVLSNPQDPARAILQGLHELGLSTEQSFHLTHGTTVATNTVLEGTGARCAYITNHGFADVLSLARQARKELYNLTPAIEPPPVPEALCFETRGRLDAEGRVLEALTEADLRDLCEQIKNSGAQSVAINLLFSWQDDTAEKRIEAALPQTLFLSRSSKVLPEIREYERGMATWLNSYVGPRVEHYLHHLHTALPHADIDIMQSHGGTLPGRLGAQNAVRLLLSGPAAGLAAAQNIGQLAGHTRILSLDMGGTSTDVALIDTDIRLSSNGTIAGYPVSVPMVDMHTIGAGGGSLAYRDDGGLLRVGPRSAGSQPGPACYARGGEQATVTDANVALGWIPAQTRLAGNLPLDVAATHAAIAKLAHTLDITPKETARGILRLINENMAQALRVVSIEQGHHPKEFCLMAFGGAGGLHLCEVAQALSMTHAMVPARAGAFSALGLLLAPQSRELSQTLCLPLQELTDKRIDEHFTQLRTRAQSELDVPADSTWAQQRRLDLRYLGQSSTLRLPWTSRSQIQEAFHTEHRKRYGHDLDAPIELVNLRLSLTHPAPAPTPPEWPQRPGAKPLAHSLAEGVEVPIYARDQLAPGQQIQGPAIVLEDTATIRISDSWHTEVDRYGNIQFQRCPPTLPSDNPK